ncbi:MAG: dihydropteroate synthase [Propioniciclava sp.]
MERPLVMGIVNVTPDSFSDGGLWDSPDAGVARGLALVAQGADVVDVGGESTRPGAHRVDAATEMARVLPVIAELAAAGVRVSVDTTRARVAAEAVAAGALIVNDVSGGMADPAMLPTVAEAGVGYIAMHWRGHSLTMDDQAAYTHTVAEVVEELAERRDAAIAAGISPENLVLDPGLGFSKMADHNWELLQGWSTLEALGQPLLLAASRKRFLGSLLGSLSAPRPVAERDVATAVLAALFAERGLWGIRTHEVTATSDALAVAARLGDR